MRERERKHCLVGEKKKNEKVEPDETTAFLCVFSFSFLFFALFLYLFVWISVLF